jgi:hypothetical protein
MNDNTISVNGGATSNVNRTAIMTRAWAIFRQTYCYPASSFPALAATASTLACAKHGQRPNRPSGLPRYRQSIADRIATLTNGIAFERFNDHWPSARANIAAMCAEISQLSR